MALHFLIVDDHFAVRHGLALTLSGLYPEAGILSVGTLAAALERAAQRPPLSLVLLDLQLGDSTGVETLRRFKQASESESRVVPVLVVSAAAEHDPLIVAHVVEECAVGYIPKDASEDVLRQGIEMARAGYVFVPDVYLRQRIRETDRDRIRACWEALTAREREIAERLIQGLTYKQVARQLQGQSGPLSDHTIRVHTQRIAWKLRLQLDDPGLDNLPAKALLMMTLGRHPREDAPHA